MTGSFLFAVRPQDGSTKPQRGVSGPLSRRGAIALVLLALALSFAGQQGEAGDKSLQRWASIEARPDGVPLYGFGYTYVVIIPLR